MVEFRVEHRDDGSCTLAVYDNETREMLAYVDAGPPVDVEAATRMGMNSRIYVLGVSPGELRRLAAGCAQAAEREAAFEDGGADARQTR